MILKEMFLEPSHMELSTGVGTKSTTPQRWAKILTSHLIRK